MFEHNKLGIFSWFGFVLPLPKRLYLIKQAGFDAVSLWWEDEQGAIAVKKEDFAKLVDDSGLIFENIHAPFNNTNDLWNENKAARNKIIKKHLNWLEDCAKYNIPFIVMHVTEGDNPAAPNKYGIESMLCLVRFAENVGVKIAIENTRSKDNISFILNEILSDHLGFCFDSSHANLYSDRGKNLLKCFSHRLIATHLSDNDGLEDRHWLPGNGIIEWKNLIEAFVCNNYQNNLTLEVCANQKEMRGQPEEFIKKAFRRLSWIRDFGL